MTQNRPWYPNDPGPPPPDSRPPLPDPPVGWGTKPITPEFIKRNKRAVLVVIVLVLGVFGVALKGAIQNAVEKAVNPAWSVGDCVIPTGSITNGDLKDASCSDMTAYRVGKVIGLHDDCPVTDTYDTDVTFRDETTDTTYCLNQIGLNTGGD